MPKKGNIPWNKGLTKETDKRLKLCAEKISETAKKRFKDKKNHPMIGKKHTQKTKLLMSKNHVDVSGIKNPFYGKNHSIKTRNYWRGIRKGVHYAKKTEFKKGNIPIKPFKKGKNHILFNNWSSREPYGEAFSLELKEHIRKKFKRICQLCFNKEINGKRLAIHHIDYTKKNNCEKNLIPLCNQCHSMTVHNRKLWTTFFNNCLKNKKK